MSEGVSFVLDCSSTENDQDRLIVNCTAGRNQKATVAVGKTCQ